MNAEVVLLLALGIGGAASLVGGFVFYRGSVSTGKRAAGASLMAAGIAMWLILGATTPAFVSTSGSPDPVVTNTSLL